MQDPILTTEFWMGRNQSVVQIYPGGGAQRTVTTRDSRPDSARVVPQSVKTRAGLFWYWLIGLPLRIEYITIEDAKLENKQILEFDR